MHDVFEGFGSETMRNILYDFIYVKNYFTLEYVNEILSKFSYKLFESNKVPKIKKEHLQHKTKLKMSASETLCLIRCFGLMFGNKVDKCDPAWKLYQILHKIVMIITSPRLIEAHFFKFEDLSKEFLQSYKELFSALKFKFLNLTHFLRVMKRNDPLVMFWSMRYESKHRHLKSIAISSNCKKKYSYNSCKKISTNVSTHVSVRRLFYK